MKILWLVNIIMPELAEHLGQNVSVFGGWLTGALNAIKESNNEIVICTTVTDQKLVGKFEINGVTYYNTLRADVASMQNDFKVILDEETPDVIHLYGTEFEHAFAMFEVADKSKTVATIQGSLIYCKDVVYCDIPSEICEDKLTHKVLRKLKKGGNSMQLQKESFEHRAKYEMEILKRANYIHGGSDWGCAVGFSVNQTAKLFDFGLILRDSFYTNDCWSYDKCEPHTIFTLFNYPIKGFHKLLDALAIVVKKFPDTKVNIVGNKFRYRHYSGLRKNLTDHAPDYNWYVQKLIEKYNLQNNLNFMGFLDEKTVKEKMLKSNVFVSASIIENQSTTLGEAMILGVPSIASCVGAMQEMIDHGEDGFLYPFSEPYMLAYYICKIFESRDLAEKFSKKGREHAQRTYNKGQNCKNLLNMYKTIVEKGGKQ